MARWTRSRLSFANVISLIALFVALGGTGYAAVKLPKNSVGSTQIKKNAVSSSKVKNGSLLAADFKAGQLPAGATGPQGAKGDPGTNGTNGAQGIPGEAAAYARVQSDGTLTPVSVAGGPVMAKGITQGQIQHVNTAAPNNTGQYCFDLDFAPRSAMVSIDNRDAAATSNQIISVSTTRGTPLTQCPAPFQDARVNILMVGDGVATDLTDQDFYIWFEK